MQEIKASHRAGLKPCWAPHLTPLSSHWLLLWGPGPLPLISQDPGEEGFLVFANVRLKTWWGLAVLSRQRGSEPCVLASVSADTGSGHAKERRDRGAGGATGSGSPHGLGRTPTPITQLFLNEQLSVSQAGAPGRSRCLCRGARVSAAVCQPDPGLPEGRSGLGHLPPPSPGGPWRAEGVWGPAVLSCSQAREKSGPGSPRLQYTGSAPSLLADSWLLVVTWEVSSHTPSTPNPRYMWLHTFLSPAL